MNSPEKIVKKTEAFCMANADEAIVKKYSKYFREGFDAWGVNSELLNQQADTIFALPGITNAGICEVCILLVQSPKYEMTSIAGLLLKKIKKQWNREMVTTLEKMFTFGINNWAHTDWICSEIIPDMIKMKLISIESLKPWRNAANKFQRRAAVVGLIKPMKKATDFKPYFEFIDPMMMDEERVVHQGLGWFLREAWKKQAEPAEKFLLKWKDSAARLIFQYATEKMTPEQKARYRKAKGN
ncbi:MAG: DNA alkylation repair protein [Bacteroidetes bacterium]|nr:DNA alkylation repair protein [Bacteroidota bacterium]